MKDSIEESCQQVQKYDSSQCIPMCSYNVYKHPCLRTACKHIQYIPVFLHISRRSARNPRFGWRVRHPHRGQGRGMSRRTHTLNPRARTASTRQTANQAEQSLGNPAIASDLVPRAP
eukprot:1291779-Lingulodinium_polyedra.AAC.1